MNELLEEQPRARSGRKPRPGPNAEMKKRRSERKKRGVVDHGFDRKLGLNEKELDHKNYRFRWVKDNPGRIASLEAREWERVTEDDIGGQEVARRMGVNDEGKSASGVLMRKWKEWFDEDLADRLNFQETRMKEMMRGKAAEQSEEGGEAPAYADKSNKVESGERRNKRNPDFE